MIIIEYIKNLAYISNKMSHHLGHFLYDKTQFISDLVVLKDVSKLYNCMYF